MGRAEKAGKHGRQGGLCGVPAGASICRQDIDQADERPALCWGETNVICSELHGHCLPPGRAEAMLTTVSLGKLLYLRWCEACHALLSPVILSGGCCYQVCITTLLTSTPCTAAVPALHACCPACQGSAGTHQAGDLVPARHCRQALLAQIGHRSAACWHLQPAMKQ